MPRATNTNTANRKRLKTIPNIAQRSKSTNVTAITSNAPATNLTATTWNTPATNVPATTSKTPPASANTTTTNRTPSSSTRPELYVTPPREQPPTQLPYTPQAPVHNSAAGGQHFRDFPPPQTLFQSTTLPPRQNSASHSSEAQTHPRTPVSASSPVSSEDQSPQQISQAPSSHGHNFEVAGPAVLPDLQEDTLRALNALLSVPDRHKFVTLLHPDAKTPNSTWFDRDDKQKLVRAITRVFTGKFDDAYYSWSWVPRERAERWFLEFAVKLLTLYTDIV